MAFIYRYTHTHTHTHAYNRILLSHVKGWNNAIYANVDGPWDDHTKKNIRKKEKINYWYHSYVESKKWDERTYLQNRSMLTDIENKLIVTQGERE